MSTTTAGPREIFERYLRAGLTEDREAQAALFSDDAVIEFPFAPPGTPSRFQGREEIRAMLTSLGRGTAQAGMRLDQDKSVMTVHETADPEVIIAEIELHVDVETTDDVLKVPYVQVWRVRDGRVVLFRDYWATTTGDFVRIALGDA
ncbi:nuclear transport factor 2 family protein [Microtetraspora glauca]|uniref:Nuclear transport factor 2 family protein n=1 Tax=Microtetraspora glauca TaxID=1996 RepID=A0ABV3GEG0_MICGL